MKAKPRYGGTLVQSLSDEEYARLPLHAVYRGDDPHLIEYKGKRIPTRDVERLIYIGERENVYVESVRGWERPWLTVYTYEVDDTGAVLLGTFKREPIRAVGPNAMDTADLAALGFSDAILAGLAKKYLDEEWVPERPGKSDRRRDLFDRVCAAVEAD